MLLQHIGAETAAIVPELIALRRTIHQHPELAGAERVTATLVADALRSAGLQVSPDRGGHGVVGVLTGGSEGATIAYRADMDAVADNEMLPSDFRSEVPGAAHLCGHDLHTVIGIGVALVLARMRERIRGRATFFFQPAEETLSGARAMIDDGVLTTVPPQEIYALHCGPLPVGTFGLMPGVGASGHDNFDLELIGPAEIDSADGLLTAVALLSTVAPANSEAEAEQHLADLQSADGPLAQFVFSGARLSVDADRRRAHIHGWIKAWPEDAYPRVRGQIRRLVRDIYGTAVAHRLAFRDARVPPMVCSAALTEAAKEHLQATFGPASTIDLRAMLPFNGEDFGSFLDLVPGAMFFLGVANPSKGFSGQVHSTTFGADERAIGIGTQAMAGWLATRLDRPT